MPKSAGILLEHLPAIYHDPVKNKPLHLLLNLFEEVLFGNGHGELEGLERKIAGIPRLFKPLPPEGNGRNHNDAGSPDKFLPWLSQWVALTDSHGLSDENFRSLIARIVPLYSKRGTKDYLEQMLAIYLGGNSVVEIYDQGMPGFTVGRSEIGINARLALDKPYFFEVVVNLEFDSDVQTENVIKQVRKIIDLAKPAHTYYSLECHPMSAKLEK